MNTTHSQPRTRPQSPSGKVDCEQSLFFFRFSMGSARVRVHWVAKPRDERNEGAFSRLQSRAWLFACLVVICLFFFLFHGPRKKRLLVVYWKSNGNEVFPERYLPVMAPGTTQMYGGPLVSLRSRHMKVIWAQITRHASYTCMSPPRASFFLVPRYYLHAPVTQSIPLSSVRHGFTWPLRRWDWYFTN